MDFLLLNTVCKTAFRGVPRIAAAPLSPLAAQWASSEKQARNPFRNPRHLPHRLGLPEHGALREGTGSTKQNPMKAGQIAPSLRALRRNNHSRLSASGPKQQMKIPPEPKSFAKNCFGLCRWNEKAASSASGRRSSPESPLLMELQAGDALT